MPGRVRAGCPPGPMSRSSRLMSWRRPRPMSYCQQPTHASCLSACRRGRKRKRVRSTRRFPGAGPSTTARCGCSHNSQPCGRRGPSFHERSAHLQPPRAAWSRCDQWMPLACGVAKLPGSSLQPTEPMHCVAHGATPPASSRKPCAGSACRRSIWAVVSPSLRAIPVTGSRIHCRQGQFWRRMPS